ncbi:TonB family protein [Stenotrophomonas indicatrix]|jgi:protein TonB|uniref:TonB family protein n=1 Tax=Stenotrophomonas indicatrix TaxID=2045451 RepID=A0ABT8QG53_9GAMM|nr:MULTISPECIES: energy transducer TonB [Stenotrophomonas]OJH80508.1 MAG: energy transducer TonB [Stenotrophomonas maltophilia]OUL10660.1 energy transducer TonB [bacterium AM6]EZP47279.1 TonB family protein [Stenotrophomonas sp. RIT309]MBA0097891.1 energy transducer TonB [Stenotrophomonas indicatrix]MCK6230876.1 TonB family protein [Stenotrophomonas indicatrix]
MVRTYPVVPLHFDPARVAAWSAAIALHLLAFLLLLIPATYQAITALPRDQTTVRFIPREEPKPIEPLPVPTEPEKVEVVHKRQATPVPAPLPTPTATVEEAQGIILPAAEPTAVQAAPTIAPSTPLAGAQLQYRSNPPPSYPIQALRNHEQGTVLLRVEVDPSGQPVNVSIERSSGSRSLDQAARQQVLRHWRFVPAERDGMAVPAIGMVPVQFSLPD